MSRRAVVNPASRTHEMPFHLRLEISERRLLLRIGDLALTAIAVLGAYGCGRAWQTVRWTSG